MPWVTLYSLLTRALTCYYFTSWSLSSGWLPCYKERDERKQWLSLGKDPRQNMLWDLLKEDILFDTRKTWAFVAP